MAAPLYVIQDDLFFAERVRMTARKLGLDTVFLDPPQALARSWAPDSVVAIQVTLNPERQLDLIERISQATPSPKVVAVSGHLETGLRRRAKSLGATLAAHSSMETVLARACQVNVGGDDARADRNLPT